MIFMAFCGAFRICKSLYGKMVWHEFLSPKKMMLTDKAGTIFFFGGPMDEGVAPQLSQWSQGDAEKDAEELEAAPWKHSNRYSR